MFIERRALEGLEVNCRTIIGTPVVYNSRSQDLGGFVEIIAPFAFKDSMGRDIRALIEHDPSKLLGRTSSGTVRLSESPTGLQVEIDLPNTRTADELLESIMRRDISGMSFGFSVPPGGDSWDLEVDPAIRTVQKANLHEVTITALPGYKATDVSIAKRSLIQANRYRTQFDVDSVRQFIEINSL